jgi:hypothetical protein
MTAGIVLHLERPAFWTEAGDSESWFRALEAIASAIQQQPQTGTPRTVAERCLVDVIAWRGAAGLFGVYRRHGNTLLPGVGLVACDGDGSWDLTAEARTLLRRWKKDAPSGLALLAGYLVRESPWLRLLLLRLHQGDWELAHWAEVRSGRAGLKVGGSLHLRCHSGPKSWFEGLEHQTAVRWLARARCDVLEYEPGVLTRKKGKDDLSLTPLTAPLHLLESVGWLSRTGEVTLPSELAADLVGTATPAQMLTDITNGHADVRGFVAAEPVLRELLATFGMSPSDDVFARWMDALVDHAMRNGALELLDAQPGQARHGRGLHADPSRKLVRWVVHTEFNDAFQNAWATLATHREQTR